MSENSTHAVEVVRVGKLTPHPNADSLSTTEVWGYPLVVRTCDWTEGQLAAYIPPDSLVTTTRPEFAFLAGKREVERIKTKKLRGLLSMGLMVPAPAGAAEGDNVAEALGVGHYEPPPPKSMYSIGGVPSGIAGPPLDKYDIDAFRRYADILFTKGEKLSVTEKIHGANARYVWCPERKQMYAGSRTQWRAESETDPWWAAMPEKVRAYCEGNPGWTVFGEVYGPSIQCLGYGVPVGEKPRFACFDIRKPSGEFLAPGMLENAVFYHGIPWVPFIGVHPFDASVLEPLAEGKTLMPGADHVREGIVLKPLEERFDPRLGRVFLKLVGVGYYENVKE